MTNVDEYLRKEEERLTRRKRELERQLSEIDGKIEHVREMRGNLEEQPDDDDDTDFDQRRGRRTSIFPRGRLDDELLTIVRDVGMPISSKDVARRLKEKYPDLADRYTDKDFDETCSSGLSALHNKRGLLSATKNGRFFLYFIPMTPVAGRRSDEDGFVDPGSVLRDQEEG